MKTAISSAPCAWAAAAMRRQIARLPKKSGVCTITQLVSSSIAAAMSSLAFEVRRQAHDPVARHMRQRRGDVGVLRMQAAGEHRLFAPRQAMRHQHRLAAGGRAVVHRGVGDLHAGQRRDLGLKLEQDLQRALRDFRLIGRVAGQKFRALDQMIDGRGDVVAIGARAEKERPDPAATLRSAIAAIARSTAISLFASGMSSRPRIRLSAGMSANSASMSATPMRASIASRSLASSGR